MSSYLIQRRAIPTWMAGACFDDGASAHAQLKSLPPRAVGSARPICIKLRCVASAAIVLASCAACGVRRSAPSLKRQGPIRAIGRKRVARKMAEAGVRHFVACDVDNWREGDVLLFRWRDGVPAKHLAIATSPATMIHAHEGAAVCEVSLSPWWRRRLAFAFAF